MLDEKLINIPVYSKNRQLTGSEQRVLDSLANKHYFELSSEDRKIANSLNQVIESYSFIINPLTSKKIQPNVSDFIVFIDSRRADVYTQVRNYLNSRKHLFTSYCAIGDADFVIIFRGVDQVFEEFKSDMLRIHKKAPVEVSAKELINCYRVRNYHMLGGVTTNALADVEDDDLINDQDSIAEIDLLQRNYRSNIVKKNYRDNDVKNLLNRWRRKGVIANFNIIRDFIPYKIKAYILILYATPKIVNDIRQDKIIRKNIKDLFEVAADPDFGEKFYRMVNYILVAEFDNINSYHKWKETLYDMALEVDNINVFTFVVEARISEVPLGLGRRHEYSKLCGLYSGREQIIEIGYPSYLEKEDTTKTIGIDSDVIPLHGLICGEKETGKSTTVVTLATAVNKLSAAVHVIDLTKDATSKLKEVSKRLGISVVTVDINNFINTTFDINAIERNIYLYDTSSENETQKVAEKLLNSIKEIKGKERELKHMFLFEEAHTLFVNAVTLPSLLFSVIEYAGRKGVGLWFSTQKLSHLCHDNKCLYNYLPNIILHKMTLEDEIKLGSTILSGFQKQQTFQEFEGLYDLPTSIAQLNRGEAFVSFCRRHNGKTLSLPPLKVKMISEV
jgi:hypothetical protein